MASLLHGARHKATFPPATSTGRADGAFDRGANRSVSILFKGAARLAMMYRKPAEEMFQSEMGVISVFRNYGSFQSPVRLTA